MEEKRSGYKVLLADDDNSVIDQLMPLFEADRYAVHAVYDGESALNAFRNGRPDIVVLDITMPKRDGLTVLREIRRDSFIPIIILSAKGEEFDKLLALELGADDYIVKPFSAREVVARCKTLLRRVHDWQVEKESTHLVIKNLEIDMSAYQLMIDGKVIQCTPKEIEIMWLLASNPGLVFTRENLLESIWGYDYLGDTRAVDSHIKRIRAKFSPFMEGWDIRTVWGVGYRFELTDQ